MTIAESAKSIEEHLRQLRREFHRHPEISGLSLIHISEPTRPY